MKKAVPELWKKILVLGDNQGAVRLSDLSSEMGIGEEETLSFLRQVFPTGSGLEIYQKNNECWVDITSKAIQYMLPLTPGEWLELHQILSSYKSIETPVTYALKKKVTENGPIKVVMELLNQLESWDEELNECQHKLVQDLESSIESKKPLKITTRDEKTLSLHPCRILHLEGELSLIAEDVHDHCLLIMPLKEMKSCDPINSSSESRVSLFEIEEFVSAIRAMNEKETRLILKIHDSQSTNLFPNHQFLGKPCMITNPNGDLIWAAYVEPCEALYEWLISLGKKVEILDPVSFKQDYLDYCEEKMRKIA